jgi:hypothetical protein
MILALHYVVVMINVYKQETRIMSLTWVMGLFRELWIHFSASARSEDVELAQVKEATG